MQFYPTSTKYSNPLSHKFKTRSGSLPQQVIIIIYHGIFFQSDFIIFIYHAKTLYYKESADE